MGIIARTKASLRRVFARNSELVRDITVSSSKNVGEYMPGTGTSGADDVWMTNGILMEPKDYKREFDGNDTQSQNSRKTSICKSRRNSY